MNTERRGVSRLIAATLAGALALTISPIVGVHVASAADPLPPLADPTGPGAFCEGAPTDNPFTDLGAETTATREVILCLVATGLTKGRSATIFDPGGTVSRRQMALFIKRLADELERLEASTPGFPKLPPYDNVPDYTDVVTEEPDFRQAIGQLTQAEIVGGFGDGTFRPDEPVSRRQMAAFVNRLQDFLSSGPYTTDGDFFDDDDGDPGEENLNALASVGIFQGDGQGNVSPGAPLTRRQMANILLRDAQVNLQSGAINAPFNGVSPTGSFPVTPADLQTLQQDGTRDYTASGLDGATAYDIVLFACDNVNVDGDNRFSFVAQGEEAPDDGAADPGDPAAELTEVNGVDSANGDDVTPANGTIAFTITSGETECVRPVVFADDADDDTLRLNPVTKQSTDPFGVGGRTQFIPAESSPVAGTTVSLIGPDYAVVDSGTVYFRTGDDYALATNSGPPTTLTPEQFGQRLSIGDGLRTCNLDTGLPGLYSTSGPNDFCLTDSAPDNPTDLAAAEGNPADTAIVLQWTAADPADAYNVYRNAESCSNTVVAELTRIDTVSASQTSYTATGLDPATTYCFVVTTVESGDESDVAVGADTNGVGQPDTGNNVVQRQTAASIEAPTITEATLGNDTGGTGDVTVGDQFVLEFSEEMNPNTVNGATFTVIDPGNDTTTFTCGASPTPDDGVTAATCALGDGVTSTVANDTLTVTVAETGDDANSGGGNDGVQHPTRITASTVLQDLDNGLTVDVPDSADVLID